MIIIDYHFKMINNKNCSDKFELSNVKFTNPEEAANLQVGIP
jgi:hypothetical protein